MDLKPGDKFGDRYQLLSRLGTSGMGEVVFPAGNIRLIEFLSGISMLTPRFL
jgi:hypothetical protein